MRNEGSVHGHNYRLIYLALQIIAAHHGRYIKHAGGVPEPGHSVETIGTMLRVRGHIGRKVQEFWLGSGPGMAR
jgi:hypothetical protein